MSIDPRKSRSHKPADDSAVFHLGPGAARTAVWRRAVMASRRVLLLVGPCRVDGGEAAATGDLGGLEDVDKARRTRRSFSRENGHPHQPRSLTLPAPSPRPLSPQATLHEEYTSKRLAEALDRVREACASSGDDGGWADVGLGAPSTKFACCSWWPDVGAIAYADGARSDQRWIEGTSVGDALGTMAAKASKRTRDTDDEDDELEATTPAEAAARAWSSSGSRSQISEGDDTSTWCGSPPASRPTEAHDPWTRASAAAAATKPESGGRERLSRRGGC